MCCKAVLCIPQTAEAQILWHTPPQIQIDQEHIGGQSHLSIIIATRKTITQKEREDHQIPLPKEKNKTYREQKGIIMQWDKLSLTRSPKLFGTKVLHSKRFHGPETLKLLPQTCTKYKPTPMYNRNITNLRKRRYIKPEKQFTQIKNSFHFKLAGYSCKASNVVSTASNLSSWQKYCSIYSGPSNGKETNKLSTDSFPTSLSNITSAWTSTNLM